MKRKIAALLAAVLLLSVCVGCGEDAPAEVASAADVVAEPGQPYRYVQRLCYAGSVGEAYWVDNDGRLWYWGISADTEPIIIVESGVVSVASSATGTAVPAAYLDTDGCVRAASDGSLLMSGIAALSSGAHYLALTSAGDVEGFGWNSNAQCGGTSTAKSYDEHGFMVPDVWLDNPVVLLRDAAQISASSYNSAAVTPDGWLYVWGDNSCGQVGNGEHGNGYPTISDLMTPEPYLAMDRVSHVRLCENTTYAFRSDGSVWAWGDGYYDTPMRLSCGGVDIFNSEFLLYADGSLARLREPAVIIDNDVTDALLVHLTESAARPDGWCLLARHSDGEVYLVGEPLTWD